MSGSSSQPTILRIANLEHELDLVRRKQDEHSRDIESLKSQGQGQVDIAAGPLKMHGSGKWLAAMLLAFAAVVFGSNGKVVQWVASIFK